MPRRAFKMRSVMSFLFPRDRTFEDIELPTRSLTEKEDLERDLSQLSTRTLERLSYVCKSQQPSDRSREQMLHLLVDRALQPSLVIPSPSTEGPERPSPSASSTADPSTVVSSLSTRPDPPLTPTSPSSKFPSNFTPWKPTLPPFGTARVPIGPYPMRDKDADALSPSVCATLPLQRYSPEELRMRDYGLNLRGPSSNSSPVSSLPASYVNPETLESISFGDGVFEYEHEQLAVYGSLMTLPWIGLGSPEELRVREYEINGGGPPLNSSNHSFDALSSFQPFAPLRFLPRVSSPAFAPPSSNFGNPFAIVPGRPIASLPQTKAGRKRVRADASSSSVPIRAPHPAPGGAYAPADDASTSPGTALALDTTPLPPVRDDSRLHPDPTTIPLPPTPPPPFEILPASLFTFQAPLHQLQGTDVDSNANARSRQQTLVNPVASSKDRSGAELRGEELALSVMLRVTEVHATERDRLQAEIDALRARLNEREQAASSKVISGTESEISAISTSLNRSLSTEVIRLKTEFDTQIVQLQNEQTARADFDFVTEMLLTQDIYDHAVRWGIGKSFAKRLSNFWTRRASTFEIRQPERIDRIEELKALVKRYTELAGPEGGTEQLPCLKP